MLGPQVKTLYGTVEGVDGSDLCVFRGMAFAKSSVGEAR